MTLQTSRDGLTYLTALFQQYLIVFAQGYTEDNGRNILKAVYPLLALASLSDNIEHAAERSDQVQKVFREHMSLTVC